MKKNLHFVIVLLLSLATYSMPQTSTKSTNKGKNSFEQMIIEKERESWEAAKSRDPATIKAIFAKDYTTYTMLGSSTLEQDFANLDKLTIESYTIEDPEVTKVTKDFAIVRYKSDIKLVSDWKPNAFRVYATSMWVNRDGKWQCITYQETPIRQ